MPRIEYWRLFLSAFAIGGHQVGFPRTQSPNPAPLQLNSMDALSLVKLPSLMKLTRGRPGIAIGLIDGPVAENHPDLASQNIREIPGKVGGTCTQVTSAACIHGTLVAGVLSARRSSSAPAICPDCTLLVRPIFSETNPANGGMPSATPEELAEAIIDCVNAGARVLNLSAALAQPSSKKGERDLQQALDYAASRGAILVAAAGNQGMLGSSAITRHPSVIPVAACDPQGWLLSESNLGSSIGRRGLMAPGVAITSLGTNAKLQTFGGTSAAAPFVTGTIALLWSEFPRADANQLKLAVTQAWSTRQRAIAPPLLDAWAAYQTMNSTQA
jgi:subtilisin family serine protease